MNLEERLKQLRPRPAPAWNPAARRPAPRWNVVVLVAAAAAVLIGVIAAITRSPAPETTIAIRRDPVRVQERERAEQAVETLRQKEVEAVRERPPVAIDPADGRLREWEAKMRLLQEERAKAERELAEARDRERTEEPVDPPPAPPTPPPAPTESAVAVVTDATGTRDLLAGGTIETTTATAVLQFPGGARVTLAAATAIQDIGVNQFSLLRGTIDAAVGRQPKDRPLVIRSPHAIASTLETALRLTVTRDASLLEVAEGAVKFARDGKSIDVKAGFGATAAPGRALAAQPLPKEEILFALDFDGQERAGIDSGSLEQGPGKIACLAAAQEGGVSKMMISASKGLFTVRGDETVSFDYWVEPKATKVNLNLRNRTQMRSHEHNLPKFTRGKWTRFSLPLAEFGDAGARAKSGDLIINLYLQALGEGSVKFYIDNLQVTRPRKGK